MVVEVAVGVQRARRRQALMLRFLRLRVLTRGVGGEVEVLGGVEVGL
jgi:hypothetical protein